MQKLWQILLGAVQFSAQGGDYERLLNTCMVMGLDVTRVCATPFGFTGWIPARQYKTLHRPARSCRCRVKIERRRGLVFRFYRYPNRTGLAVGAILFCLLCSWLQGCIWTVSYYNLNADTATKLALLLQQNQVTRGSRPTTESLATVRQKILLEDGSYASLSFNFVKGRLIVEATPAQMKPAIIALQRFCRRRL